MNILESIVDSPIQVVSIYDTSRAFYQEEDYRCNQCGAANARKMPNSEHKYFMAFLDLQKLLTVPLKNYSSES